MYGPSGGPGGGPGFPPPGFDPNALHKLPLPFDGGQRTFPDIGDHPLSGQSIPGFNPGQTSPLDPNDPAAQMPPWVANTPPIPLPELQFGGFPSSSGMLTNNLSAYGSPNYAGGVMSQQGFQDWLRMILLGMAAGGK